MMRAVATTGIATSEPGYGVVLVKPVAAPTIPAMPAHVRAAASTGASRRSWGAPTATRPPSASSQARVNGEKYAVVGLLEVWTIDQVSEAAPASVRNVTSFPRSDSRRRATAASTKKIVG